MPTKIEALSEPAPDEDAVALLTADHKRVASLFAQFANLKDSRSDDAKSTLVATICQELVVHTAIEEEIFYPAVRIAIDDENQMDESLVEHAGAKELIAQLRAASPTEALYNAKVTVLGEQIGHHVDEEEGSMFPQARASELDLTALAADMRARKAALLADPTILMAPPAALGAGDDGEGDVAEADEEEKSDEKASSPAKRKTAQAKSALRSSKTKKTLSTTPKKKRS